MADTLLRQQAKALGRRLKPTEIFRQAIRREVDGRPYSELGRRISAPNRIRDDLAVDGAWRFSESFDGECAWYRDKSHPTPTLATGLALAAYRWTGVRLDHLQPLERLTRLGCRLEGRGFRSTGDGQSCRAIQISMLDQFAETVFLDGHGRIVAHHVDLPEAGEEERKLEVLVREWGEHQGLVHPVRSTVLDRTSGEMVAVILVTAVHFEPYRPEVFDLTAD